MAERQIVAGVDVAKLEAFRGSLKEKPTSLGLSARAVWEGEMGRSTVHIGPYQLGGNRIDRETRRYTIPYGAWKEVEQAAGAVGPTDRQEPVEMALGALASCLIVSITYNAHRHGIKLDDLEVSVSTDVSPDVLLELRGPEEHPACMQNLRAQIKVKGENLTPEKLETIKKLAEHSPVHGLLSYANRVTTAVGS
ncbi:MAG: OsmC family protein [Dehalococcoidia bacterium]